MAITGCATPYGAPATQAPASIPLPSAIVAQATSAPQTIALAPTTVPTRLAAAATPVPSPSPLATATPKETLSSIDPTLAADLQRILDQLVEDGFIPGAVLAVHIPGQKPWAGASGFIDQQRTQLMKPTTQVRIASISKVFTAVIVLQLVEEGKLDLDAPVSTWFPRLVPRASKTTVRNLLNHTTGLYDYLEDRSFLARAFQAPDRHWTPEELVAYAARHPSAFQPGQPGMWDYSSTNYVMLGMIVEQVTGNSLAHEMRQRILTPLELRHTFFPPEEAVPGIQARGYRQNHDQTNISLSFAFATANLVSTVGDVQRFGEALFGGRLLKPATLEAMYTFENGKGQYNMPKLEYGLGVMRNQLAIGRDAHGQARPALASTVLGHTGGFAGFRSALWYEPASGITIALGMNQGATDPNILATLVMQAIVDWQGR
ncbi:MAG TPA: serine hydrolase [Roseiflexaceae bacterium]|nr:serine hydrolase [Roseiflexaceae bacterium]